MQSHVDQWRCRYFRQNSLRSANAKCQALLLTRFRCPRRYSLHRPQLHPSPYAFFLGGSTNTTEKQTGQSMRFGRVMTSMSEALKLPTPGRCDASDILRWVQHTTSRERAALFTPCLLRISRRNSILHFHYAANEKHESTRTDAIMPASATDTAFALHHPSR